MTRRNSPCLAYAYNCYKRPNKFNIFFSRRNEKKYFNNQFCFHSANWNGETRHERSNNCSSFISLPQKITTVTLYYLPNIPAISYCHGISWNNTCIDMTSRKTQLCFIHSSVLLFYSTSSSVNERSSFCPICDLFKSIWTLTNVHQYRLESVSEWERLREKNFFWEFQSNW